MSLFVAVIPPTHAVEDLHDTITDVRRGVPAGSVRWSAPERWHITLAFLGDPDEDIDEDVAEHLAPLADEPAIEHARLASAGEFGRQVLWIGLEEGPAVASLAPLARAIPGMVRGTGVVPDRRPWRPHLTIARMRPGAGASLVPALAHYRGPEWAVDALHLVRSTGGPHPAHRTVASFALA